MKSLMPIIVILISVGLYFLHISPRYAEVQTLKLQQAEYVDALSRVKELGVTRDTLLAQYNTISQDNLARLTRIAPDSVNTVKLAADIDSVAGKYGITIRNIVAAQQVIDSAQVVGQGSNAPKPYQTTTIGFRFSASYPNLVSFLKDLEKSLEIIDIKSVSFTVPTDSSSGIYEYQVSIQTYSLQ